MKYTAPSFTVPTGHRPAAACSHGWLDVRGRCVFCGANVRTDRHVPPGMSFYTMDDHGRTFVVRSTVTPLGVPVIDK